jgi:hypothetical protein
MIAFAALVVQFTMSGVIDPVFRDGFDADACGAQRLQISDIAYSDGTLEDVDTRLFDNIWGRSSVDYPPQSFPATSTTATIVDWNRTTFLAARFHIDSFTPDYYSGLFSYADAGTPGNPHVDFSISAGCGDFSPELGACVVFDAAPENSALVQWDLVAHDLPSCVLEAGRDYFANLRATDPSAPAPDCSGDICAVRISSDVALP